MLLYLFCRKIGLQHCDLDKVEFSYGVLIYWEFDTFFTRFHFIEVLE